MGLSTDGDAVDRYNAVGVLQANVVFPRFTCRAVTAIDNAGNRATASLTITVPHDRGK